MNDALDEIIEIGRSTKMPVQVSHIKIAKRDDWGKAKQILKRLEQARAEGINICADIYPYTFWNSTLRVLFPDKQFTNMQSAQFAVDQLFDANESVVVAFAPNSTYVGKTLAVIAAQRKEQPAQTLMNLIQMASDFDAQNPDYKGSTEAIAGKSMNENDVVDFIQWPYANICSDGNAGGHPRGYGAFTRVLGKYVREKKLMPLETAIYKMTGMTADFLAIKDRGVIAVGKKADMVLLNPATVNDNATINNSKLLSTGIETVWVNGQIVYKAQKATGKLPGVLLIK
jgi:N-acyl-D-aspartate/D-glutamate deacylase